MPTNDDETNEVIGEDFEDKMFEYRDKCLGQDKCKDCPRYLDDCDGREDKDEEE